MGLFNKKSKRTIAIEAYVAVTEMNYLNKDEFGLINYFKGFKLMKSGRRTVSDI